MVDALQNCSGWSEQWPAPAKLNLMLRITGRRDDGYHNLQTVFQIIDLCDWLIFHPLDNNQICRKQNIPGVPEDEDLTVRAAKLLQAETGYRGGVSIELEKNLPMGGGLGGGSSDAATTLLVLNKLWGLGLSVETLMELGLTLGADVPVFVYGCNSWAEGVGEFLQKMSLPKFWYVVLKPNCHVNTKEIFSAENLTRDSKPIKMADFLAGHERQNDCLQVVKNSYKAVAEGIAKLSEFGDARLTGTGSCVFVQFNDKAVAQRAFEILQRDWQVYLTKGVDVSPLQEKLSAIR